MENSAPPTDPAHVAAIQSGLQKKEESPRGSDAAVIVAIQNGLQKEDSPLQSPNDAAVVAGIETGLQEEKSPSPSPPLKKPKLDGEEETFFMEVDSQEWIDSRESEVDVNDCKDDEDDVYLGLFYDFWNKDEEDEYDDGRYDEVKNMAEFVMRDLNTESIDKAYKLLEVEKVLWSSNLMYILTFTAKELGADADDDADGVVKTFEACVQAFPNSPYELLERAVAITMDDN